MQKLLDQYNAKLTAKLEHDVVAIKGLQELKDYEQVAKVRLWHDNYTGGERLAGTHWL